MTRIANPNYADATVLVTNPVFIGIFERPCLEPPPYVLGSITTFGFLVGFTAAAHVSVTCGVRVCLLVAVYVVELFVLLTYSHAASNFISRCACICCILLSLQLGGI